MFTVEEICEEQERQYNQLMQEDGQYCHPESFKWGFEHGFEYALSKFGWHPASELPVIPEGKNWVKVVALVDFGDNTLRPRHEIYKDKGWSKKICGQLNTGAIHQRKSDYGKTQEIQSRR